MMELALIALLGAGDLTCGDAYLSNGRYYSITGDIVCVMKTDEQALCTVVDDETSPFSARITLDEINGELTISINGIVVGSCD